MSTSIRGIVALWLLSAGVLCHCAASALGQTAAQQPDVIVSDEPPAAQAPVTVNPPSPLDAPRIPGLLPPTTAPAPGPSPFASTPSTTASASQGPRAPQTGYNVRLARAPKMLGDFFGRGNTTVTMPGMDQNIVYNPFMGQRDFFGLGDSVDFGSARLVVLPSGLGEFRPGTVFGQSVNGVAFRTLTPVAGLTAGTIPLEIVGQDGSGVSDADALMQVQNNADAFLPFDAQADLASQQSVIAGETGGTFVPIGPDTTTVLDPEAEASAGPIDETTPFQLRLPYDVIFSDAVFTPESMTIVVPSPTAGDIVGRVRMQDNNSPLPQDRVFFDYNFFYNVPLTSAGTNVNRFTPGAEKTFLDGMASAEIRVPMGLTLDSQVSTDLPANVDSYEFGNLTVATKFLLTSNDELAVAAGLGVSIPTADDIEIGLSDGTALVSIDNDSVHILPYLAFLYLPRGGNCFLQSFLTLDIDANGTPVAANVNGTGLESIGVWNDQNLITWSVSGGTFLYENFSRNASLKRVAWSGEIHWTETLNDADSAVSGSYIVGDPNAELSLVNATFGLHTTVEQTTFTFGYTVPLTSDDRVFDGEFRAFANRPF
ncbi:MAG: hypothetical protein AAGA92_03690 [Planctomycetota bacterium]